VGLFILGFSQSMSFVPALPEAIDCTVERLGDHEEVHNTVSSLFTLMWSSGVLSGTLLGGLMYDRIGFDSSIKVAILLMILVTPLYVKNLTAKRNIEDVDDYNKAVVIIDE
jgi:predicted MFS family arabinose efflux permease